MGLKCDQALHRVLNHLGIARANHGLAILLWHQRTYHNRRYRGWGQVYRQLVEWLAGQTDAWATSLETIADWWLRRETARLVQAKYDDGRYRWVWQVGQATIGLTFRLTAPSGCQVEVQGADAGIRPGPGHCVWIEFASLAAGETIKISCSGNGAAQ